METPHLDKIIEWLEWAKNGTNWNSEREKQLAEYKAIKQTLRIHDVSSLLKAEREATKEEIREWLRSEDFEGLAERI